MISLLFMKSSQRLINYHELKMIMKISQRSMAMVLLGVIAMSTSGVYSLTQNVQTTPTSSGAQESPVVLGHITAVVKDQYGNIKAYRQTDNMVVSNGLNATTNLLFGSGLQTTTAIPGIFKYVGVGTASTAVAYTQTDLAAQRGAHVLGSVTAIHAGLGTGMGAQIVGNWAAGKLANASSTSVTLNEAGLFDGFNSTNMYARQVLIPGISLGTADTLAVTWQITFAHT